MHIRIRWLVKLKLHELHCSGLDDLITFAMGCELSTQTSQALKGLYQLAVTCLEECANGNGTCFENWSHSSVTPIGMTFTGKGCTV